MTLCVIVQDGRVLLGMKKRGLGVGRWNGFGGKVDEGESIEEAAIRELREEVQLVASNLSKRGIIEFEFENDEKILEVHIFDVGKIDGEAQETEEMKPQWFDTDKIPFESMWPDDEHWMPYFLSGKKFRGKVLFDRPSDTEYTSKILSMNMEEVENI